MGQQAQAGQQGRFLHPTIHYTGHSERSKQPSRKTRSSKELRRRLIYRLICGEKPLHTAWTAKVIPNKLYKQYTILHILHTKVVLVLRKVAWADPWVVIVSHLKLAVIFPSLQFCSKAALCVMHIVRCRREVWFISFGQWATQTKELGIKLLILVFICFLVKKLEIEKTKPTFIISVLKVEY